MAKNKFFDRILFFSAGFHEAMKTRFYWLKFPSAQFLVCVKSARSSHQVKSMGKRAPGWLGYIGDDKLPNYIGIILNHL